MIYHSKSHVRITGKSEGLREIAMTAEELKAKRLSLGYRSRNAMAKALGVSKYAVEHWEYGRRAIPGWVPRFLQCLETLARSFTINKQLEK
jgi:DNA-binding transcriptional regulator YiaG